MRRRTSRIAQQRVGRTLLLLAPWLLVAGTPIAAQNREAAASLRVAAVQLSVDAEMLGSLEAFRARVTERVERSVAQQPDLIVFPEYTAAFLALIPYRREVAGAASVAEALQAVRGRDPLVGGLRDLFLLNSGWVERAVDEMFGGLARRYGVAILAGSYFAWTEEGRQVRLTNRAVVFGPDGRRLYQQDKVYLTDFEEELLGLSPGELSAARPFPVAGARVGVSICRDTFFPAWEDQLAGSDLWVDIKANGTAYTEQERQRFDRALPARVRSGEIPFGLTVCLVGAFLDLLWEGESSLVRREIPAGVTTLRTASSPRAEDILLLSIPLRAPPR